MVRIVRIAIILSGIVAYFSLFQGCVKSSGGSGGNSSEQGITGENPVTNPQGDSDESQDVNPVVANSPKDTGESEQDNETMTEEVISIDVNHDGHKFKGLATTLGQDKELTELAESHPELMQKILDLAYKREGEVEIFGKKYKCLGISSLRLKVNGEEPKKENFPYNDTQYYFVTNAVKRGIREFWCSHHYGLPTSSGPGALGTSQPDNKIYPEMVALFVKKYKETILKETSNEITMMSAIANEPDLNSKFITDNPVKLYDLTLYLKQLLEGYGIDDPVMYPEVAKKDTCFEFLDAIKTLNDLDKIGAITVHSWVKQNDTLANQLYYAELMKELVETYFAEGTELRDTEYGLMSEDNNDEGSSPDNTILEDVANDGVKVCFRIIQHLTRGFNGFTYFADIGADRFPNPTQPLWSDKYSEGNLVQLNKHFLTNNNPDDDANGLHVPGRAGVWAAFNQYINTGSIIIESSTNLATVDSETGSVSDISGYDDGDIAHVFFRDEADKEIVGIIASKNEGKNLHLILNGTDLSNTNKNATLITLTDEQYFTESSIQPNESGNYEVEVDGGSINIFIITYASP